MNNTPVLDTLCELTSYIDRQILFRWVILPPSYRPCICQTRLFSPPPLTPRRRGSRFLSASPLFTIVHFCCVGAYIEILLTMTCGITPILQQSTPVCHLIQKEIVNVESMLLADTFITTPHLNSCCKTHDLTVTLQHSQPLLFIFPLPYSPCLYCNSFSSQSCTVIVVVISNICICKDF